MAQFDTLYQALKSLNEGMSDSVLQRHFEYNIGNKQNFETFGDITVSGHGHVAVNQKELEAALKNKDIVYFNLSKNDYRKEAEELALADSKDYTPGSMHNGVESFMGLPSSKAKEYVYKIRWTSKLISKSYFNSIQMPFLWDIYTEELGTSNFCDIVIFKNNASANYDPEIVTFYTAPRSEMEAKVKNWVSGVNAQNNPDDKFVIIDSLGKGYSKNNPPGEKLPYLKCIVVHPDVTKSVKNRQSSTQSGTEINNKYVSGYYVDSNGQKVELNMEKASTSRDAIQRDKSSSYIGTARDIFEQGAMKAYANNVKGEYHASTTANIKGFWASSPKNALDQIMRRDDIQALFKTWGLDAEENYRLWQNNINSIKKSLDDGWQK